jgi:hypothetical protein
MVEHWSELGVVAGAADDCRDRAQAVIDVAIVGGGGRFDDGDGAGASGLSAVVIERSAYDNLRIGETLPPAIREVLTELGVWERFVRDGHAPSHGTHAAWGSSALHANDFIFNPHGHGWHVNRSRFDRMLAVAARDAGLVIRERTRLISHRRVRARLECANPIPQTDRPSQSLSAGGRVADPPARHERWPLGRGHSSACRA